MYELTSRENEQVWMAILQPLKVSFGICNKEAKVQHDNLSMDGALCYWNACSVLEKMKREKKPRSK